MGFLERLEGELRSTKGYGGQGYWPAPSYYQSNPYSGQNASLLHPLAHQWTMQHAGYGWGLNGVPLQQNYYQQPMLLRNNVPPGYYAQYPRLLRY